MPGRNGQRKPGTARGSPRRSRTAKASRISRRAVKSRCACERGGWGQLSDDGPRQHNSGRSEDPWGSGDPTSWRCTIESATRHCAGLALDHEVHERWMQTGQHAANVGSRLKLAWKSGRRHLKSQPSSRIGENPPYGMIGGIEETSASFEARSAPRSYPTTAVAGLFRLDPQRLDDRPPFLRISLYKRAERLRCLLLARENLQPEIAEPRSHRRIG